MGRRVVVDLNDMTMNALELLAATQGKPVNDILADAIQLEAWVAASTREGWHLLLEKNGRVRELAQ